MAYPSFQELKVVLTASQLLTLHTSPVLLVAGVAGTIIDVNSIYYRYLHGTTVFNPASTDGVMVVNGIMPNVLSEAGYLFATGFLDQSVDMSAWGNPMAGSPANTSNFFISGVPLSYFVGQGLYLYQGNVSSPSVWGQGANWTQGNGELAVFLKYAFLELP
jgi:hypothetical protein